MARISDSRIFLSATEICVWWTRLKQQPKPLTTNEKKKKKIVSVIFGSNLSY